MNKATFYLLEKLVAQHRVYNPRSIELHEETRVHCNLILLYSHTRLSTQFTPAFSARKKILLHVIDSSSFFFLFISPALNELRMRSEFFTSPLLSGTDLISNYFYFTLYSSRVDIFVPRSECELINFHIHLEVSLSGENNFLRCSFHSCHQHCNLLFSHAVNTCFSQGTELFI